MRWGCKTITVWLFGWRNIFRIFGEWEQEEFKAIKIHFLFIHCQKVPVDLFLGRNVFRCITVYSLKKRWRNSASKFYLVKKGCRNSASQAYSVKKRCRNSASKLNLIPNHSLRINYFSQFYIYTSPTTPKLFFL